MSAVVLALDFALVLATPAAIVDPTTIAEPSFRNHVIPVLTKAGCNMGSCHGASAGKNGFKMTLRGYDADVDHARITREAAARRVNLMEPAQSLLLLKPTLAVAHAGGKRLEAGSPEYGVIARWIAAGALPPRDDDARITDVEILPRTAKLAVGQELRLTVRARFSDGHVEDVTRWAKWASGDDSVAKVGDDGLVKVDGRGETAISVWYASRVAFMRVLSPFADGLDPALVAASPRRNFIDDHAVRKLAALGIPPSPDCKDQEFIRRAYLDAAGILPTGGETAVFLKDARPDKRARLIEDLLRRPEFVDYWAYKWSDLLLVATHKLPRKNVQAFYEWIRDSVAANKGWDRFVRELATASGRATQEGAVNYYLIHRNPLDLAENFSMAFLGTALNCARCHNHPLEKWTQNEYYGFANLFARVAHKSSAEDGDFRVFSTPSGDVAHPKTGLPMAPKPLDAPAMSTGAARDRRTVLADWLTSPGNKLFSRTVVNRVWQNFFGRGLVHPVDDMRATNPASNHDLFEAVTADFVRHRFDVKHLVRTIMNSAAYQRSSEAVPANAKDDRYLSHYIPRRLPAEVILDAIAQVTGVPEEFAGYPTNIRAMQLPDTKVDSHFMTVFGRPARLVTSAAERQQDPTLSQALHVMNGDTLNKKLTSKAGRIEKLWQSSRDAGEVIEELYLCAYSRRPTDDEKRRAIAAWRDAIEAAAAKPEARRQVLEDIAWAMLTSKEFFFNH